MCWDTKLISEHNAFPLVIVWVWQWGAWKPPRLQILWNLPLDSCLSYLHVLAESLTPQVADFLKSVTGQLPKLPTCACKNSPLTCACWHLLLDIISRFSKISHCRFAEIIFTAFIPFTNFFSPPVWTLPQICQCFHIISNSFFQPHVRMARNEVADLLKCLQETEACNNRLSQESERLEDFIRRKEESNKKKVEELKRKLLIAKERKEELERKVRKLTETKEILEAEGQELDQVPYYSYKNCHDTTRLEFHNLIV